MACILYCGALPAKIRFLFGRSVQTSAYLGSVRAAVSTCADPADRVPGGAEDESADDFILGTRGLQPGTLRKPHTCVTVSLVRLGASDGVPLV